MPINQSIYFFGNSLVNYAEGGAQTNIPVWMNRFAEFQGNELSVEGGYGFLRNFADAQEPNTDWGFEGVSEVYDSDRTSFAEVPFDNVVITPSNFVQDQSPETGYFDGDRSPLEATRQIVEGLQDTQPDARIFIYEGWADMASYAPDGNPNPAELAAYHDYNTGEYHDWYTSLVEQTQAAVPGAEVTLIPVASVLSEILSSQPLSEIPVEDLYVDSAPHGTETLYFLAGLTTYAAIYGTVPPADFGVPSVVNPTVANNFIDVAETIATSLQARGFDVSIPEPGLGSTEPGNVVNEPETEVIDQEQAEEPAPLPPVEEAAEQIVSTDGEDTYYPGEALSIPEEDAVTPVVAPPLPAPAAREAEEPTETDAELSFGPISVTSTSDYDNVARTVDIPEAGAYRFELTSDEEAVLHINGEPVLTNTGTTPEASQDATVDLEAGSYLLEVFVYEQNGGEILVLDVGPEAALAETEAAETFLPGKEFDEIPEEDAEEDLSFF